MRFLDQAQMRFPGRAEKTADSLPFIFAVLGMEQLEDLTMVSLRLFSSVSECDFQTNKIEICPGDTSGSTIHRGTVIVSLLAVLAILSHSA